MSRVASQVTVRKQPGTISFHKVNVGKGGKNMDIASQQVWDAMLQEPWTMFRDGHFLSKRHPGYNSHISTGDIRVRLGAITYTRKGLRTTQILPSGKSADYCFVLTYGITFVIVYCVLGPSGTLEPLMN